MESMRDSSDEEGGDEGSDEEEEEWEGFAEPPVVDYEAEYIDEDKYTTVTVEDLDPSKEEEEGGLKSKGDAGEEENGGENGGQKKTLSIPRKNAKAKGKPDKSKGKKKKFRYESYAERKVTRLKDRAGNKAKAKARHAR
jgi:ribosomal RNA-processing protein 17